MRDLSFQSHKYPVVIIGGLALFSLSLALSKSAANVSMALVYLTTLFFTSRHQDFRKTVLQSVNQPLLLPFALYLSAALIGLLFTENVSDGLGIVNKFVGLLLVYLMVSALIEAIGKGEGGRLTAEKLLLAFLIGIFTLDSIAVMTYLGLIGDKKFALPFAPLHVHHIWFANLNALGMYAAAAFLLFAPRQRGHRIMIFSLSFIILGGVSVLFSVSRTAWLGMFFTTVILTYLMVKQKKVFFMVLLGMLGAGVSLYFFNRIVHMRLNEIVSDISLFFAGEANTNVGERFLMWKAAFRMFLSNPLFGVGTGDYFLTMGRYMASGEFPEYLAQFNQPHNMYLFALATNGLVGLSALLYIFYRVLRFSVPLLRTHENEKKLFAFLATAAVAHYMAAGMTDSFFNIQILRYAFAFVMGVCVRNSMKTENVKL